MGGPRVYSCSRRGRRSVGTPAGGTGMRPAGPAGISSQPAAPPKRPRSLHGVLHRPGRILQQVPLLHRRQVGGRCKVEVVSVGEHLRAGVVERRAGVGGWRHAVEQLGRGAAEWAPHSKRVHMKGSKAAALEATARRSLSQRPPSHLELGWRAAVAAADDGDARQLDRAVEWDVQQQLRVILLAVCARLCSSGVRWAGEKGAGRRIPWWQSKERRPGCDCSGWVSTAQHVARRARWPAQAPHCSSARPAAPSCAPGSPLLGCSRWCQGLNTLRQLPSTASFRQRTWRQQRGGRVCAHSRRQQQGGWCGSQLSLVQPPSSISPPSAPECLVQQPGQAAPHPLDVDVFVQRPGGGAVLRLAVVVVRAAALEGRRHAGWPAGWCPATRCLRHCPACLLPLPGAYSVYCSASVTCTRRLGPASSVQQSTGEPTGWQRGRGRRRRQWRR